MRKLQIVIHAIWGLAFSAALAESVNALGTTGIGLRFGAIPYMSGATAAFVVASALAGFVSAKLLFALNRERLSLALILLVPVAVNLISLRRPVPIALYSAVLVWISVAGTMMLQRLSSARPEAMVGRIGVPLGFALGWPIDVALRGTRTLPSPILLALFFWLVAISLTFCLVRESDADLGSPSPNWLALCSNLCLFMVTLISAFWCSTAAVMLLDPRTLGGSGLNDSRASNLLIGFLIAIAVGKCIAAAPLTIRTKRLLGSYSLFAFAFALLAISRAPAIAAVAALASGIGIGFGSSSSLLALAGRVRKGTWALFAGFGFLTGVAVAQNLVKGVTKPLPGLLVIDAREVAGTTNWGIVAIFCVLLMTIAALFTIQLWRERDWFEQWLTRIRSKPA